MSFLRYFRLSPRSRRAFQFTLPVDTDPYSTEEVSTPSTWIDGRTIYRKVVTFPNGPNGAQLAIPHGISGLAFFTRFYGSMHSPAGDNIPLPYVSQASVTFLDSISLQVDADTIRITPDQDAVSPVDWSTFQGFVVLEYVKTS